MLIIWRRKNEKISKTIFCPIFIDDSSSSLSKDKEKAQTEQGQTKQEQNYDYQEMLMLTMLFNISGDLVIMFSDDIDKKSRI